MPTTDSVNGGGAFVAAVLLLGFFGYAHWYQIPGEVGRVLPNAVTNYVNTEYPGFRENLEIIQSEAAQASAAAKQADKELNNLLNKARALDDIEQRLGNQIDQINDTIVSITDRMSSILTPRFPLSSFRMAAIWHE